MIITFVLVVLSLILVQGLLLDKLDSLKQHLALERHLIKLSSNFLSIQKSNTKIDNTTLNTNINQFNEDLFWLFTNSEHLLKQQTTSLRKSLNIEYDSTAKLNTALNKSDIFNNIEEINLFLTTTSQILREHSINHFEHTYQFTISSVLIDLFIFILSLVLIYGGVITPIKSLPILRKLIRKVSENGDLSIQYELKGDNEIDQVGNEFNILIFSMRHTLKKSVSTIEQITANAKQLSINIEQTNNGIQQQQQQSSQAETSTSALTKKSEDIINNTSQALTATESAHQQAKDGSDSVHDIIKSIETVASDTESIANIVNLLITKTENINNMVDSIESIASQTNLLALNAAIEAARAGESGRGFAVVADEVRALAVRTKNSTEDIKKTTEELLTYVNKANNEIINTQNNVTDSVSKANIAEDKLNNILKSTNTIKRMNSEISESAQHQHSDALDVHKNIDSIKNIIGLISQTSNIVTAVSHEMDDLTSELSQELGHFKNPEDEPPEEDNDSDGIDLF